MARTQIVAPYTFSGADNSQVSVLNSGNDWVEQDGVNGYVYCKSNGYWGYGTAYSDCCWKGAGTFTADQYFKCRAQGTTTNGSNEDKIGGSLRNNGASWSTRTMYRVYWTPHVSPPPAAAASVWKVVSNGTPTQIGADIAFTMAAGDFLSAEAITNGANVDIKVYLNDVLQGTRTDTSSVLTTGKPGVFGYKASAEFWFDQWSAGTGGLSAAVAGQPAMKRGRGVPGMRLGGTTFGQGF